MSQERQRLGFADVLSLVLNPSLLTGAFLCLLAGRLESPGPARLLHASLGVIFAGLVPIGTIFILKARGRLSDVEMSLRHERDLVYMLCAAGYALGAGLLLVTGAGWPLWGLLALHVPNTLILALFNLRLKVSIHTMVITSLWIAALMFFGMSMVPAGMLIPAAAWGRWRAGNHSPAELVSGILIGGGLTPIEILALRFGFGG